MLSQQRLSRFQLAECLLALGAILSGGLQAGPVLAQAETESSLVQAVLNQADAARLDNEAKLKSAFGTANLQQEIFEAGAKRPLTLTKATMKLAYDSPKFLIEIDNEIRLRETTNAAGQGGRRWRASEIAKVLVLFDGEALYLVEWDDRGGCQGEIYFAFSRQAVLRAAGFPFEHPIHIWREALNISQVKATRTTITPRTSGGFMATERMASYDRKFFIFDRFGYDLRRVSTQRTDNGIPIREYTLRWSPSAEEVYYLSEFSNTVTKTGVSYIDSQQEFVSKTTTKVAYEEFEVNPKIPQQRFNINLQDIPAGTEFVDKRRRTQRNSATLKFDGAKLVPTPQ